MPPYSSHLLQPLDVGVFGPLKKAYSKELNKLIRVGISYITKEDFFPAFRAVFDATITEQNIQAGFRGTGLVPLNAQRVISTLDVKLSTPTLSPTSSRSSQLLTSRTPKSHQDATKQVKVVKNRIFNHQNSSPTKIFESLDSLVRGITSISHRAALAEAQVAGYQSTLEQLSKRQRAKKTRLRNGASLL